MLADRVAGQFLDEAERRRLRIVLASMAEGTQGAFMEALSRPPIDGTGLMTTYRLKPQDRQRVAGIARSLLLDRPSLHRSPEHLESLVEKELVGQLKAASNRVMSRFLEGYDEE